MRKRGKTQRNGKSGKNDGKSEGNKKKRKEGKHDK